jgi:DegV family protein with EDD domain
LPFENREPATAQGGIVRRLIVTDSTADLPAETIKEKGIHVVPVNVVLNGKSYRDGVDITSEQFYRNFDRYAEKFTRPVQYEDYALEYMQLVKKYDEILCIHCTKHLSDTFETALKVHEDLMGTHKCRVAVIDSELCSMGMGLIVAAAADAINSGMDISAAQRVVGDVRSRTSSWMAIPTLKYLKKNKKISGMKALFGLALGVKPVLTFDKGKMVVKTKLFGEQKNMILSMMDMIREDIGSSPITLAIVHTGDQQMVENLRGVFESTFECRKIFTSYFGPSIGINTGPDSISVMYIKEA